LALFQYDSGDETSGALRHEGALTKEGAVSASDFISPIIAEHGGFFNALRAWYESTADDDESFGQGDTDEESGLDPDILDNLSQLSSVFVSSKKEVFLAFSQCIIYRETADDGTNIDDYDDPWSCASPFTCQIFKLNEPYDEYDSTDRVKQSNLDCVNNELEINTWDYRSGQIQGDGTGNVYFWAHVPGNWKNVLLEHEVGAAINEQREVINSNICSWEYLVTDDGAVLYTGQTSTSGSCGGDSFCRMVAAGGSLIEITRDWWEYVFEPRANGHVLFYGPDPTVDGAPSWDSACLFDFDPDLAGDDAAYDPIVSCTNNWWEYVTYGPDETTAANDTESERCAQEFYTLQGGNSPEKILLPTVNDAEEVCVIADVEKKVAGEWRCNICVNSGSNCENSSGMITGDITQSTCTATTGNTWVSSNECYNDVTTSACTLGTTIPTGWDLSHNWCQDTGDWSNSYSALACIEDESLDVISATNETVVNGWVVNDNIYYSYVDNGTYVLKKVTFDEDGTATATDLIEGIEMYEVGPSGSDEELTVNGLRFSDNSYVFGAVDIETGDTNFDTGLTGIVEAIIILDE
jgi:hypothetical protein